MLSMTNNTMSLIQGKIARETGYAFRTIRKYVLLEDLSEKIVKKKFFRTL